MRKVTALPVTVGFWVGYNSLSVPFLEGDMTILEDVHIIPTVINCTL